MAKQLDVGGILSETVAIVQDNLRNVLIFTGAIGGLSAIGALIGPAPMGSDSIFSLEDAEMLSAHTPAMVGLQLLTLVATIVGLYWLTKNYLISRNRLATDANRFWHYIGMSIIAAIGMMIGFVLLIVPGIILLVRWSAAVGYVVSGKEGVIDSLKASWEVTRGNGLTIFLAGLVMFVVLIVVLGVIAAILVAANLRLGMVIGGFLDAFSNTISPAFAIAVYCMLQNDGEQLEEVFS